MSASFAALIHLFAFAGFVVLLLAAAANDMRFLVIPNRLCLSIAALWPAFALTGTVPVNWVAAPTIAFAVLAMGFALYAAGVTGGGDVKLLAAIALWAGPHSIAPFAFVTAVAGGVISLVLLAAHRFRPVPAPADVPVRRSWFHISVPYGVAIAVGGLSVAGRLAVI